MGVKRSDVMLGIRVLVTVLGAVLEAYDKEKASENRPSLRKEAE